MNGNNAKNENEVRAGILPPLINWALLLFYVITWLNLIYTAYLAFVIAQGGDSRFLFPAGLTILLFIAFLAINYIHYRRHGGSIPDILWGFDKPAWRSYAFILIWLALVYWTNALSPDFFWLYTALMGATFGLFPLRVAIALVGVELLALFSQIAASISTAGLYGLGFFLTISFTLIVLLTQLIRSRIASEVLVRELREAQAQLEQAARKEKEVAVLRERDRMAREMHDVLGHALVLVAVKIEAAQRLQSVNPERAAEELDSTKELVRQSMADLRTSLADLRSPALEGDAVPLSQSLREWMASTLVAGNYRTTFNAEAGTDNLPAPLQDAFWRVGREAVLNIVKHARARQVEINLFTKDDQVFLTVTDDGVGIPHLADGTARLEIDGHYGVRGMRERLEALGGHLIIKPGRDGNGTMVLASVPLPAGKQEMASSNTTTAPGQDSRLPSLFPRSREPR
ncbi:MAG: sensor histidine kinase [Chloroflexota bacterium]